MTKVFYGCYSPKTRNPVVWDSIGMAKLDFGPHPIRKQWRCGTQHRPGVCVGDESLQFSRFSQRHRHLVTIAPSTEGTYKFIHALDPCKKDSSYNQNSMCLGQASADILADNLL
jgi:hypothetical protein